jgi:hypothetical protein
VAGWLHLDAPAYGTWLREKLEVYEVMTGRKAVGVLLGVVGRENMLRDDALPMIRQSVLDNEGVTLKLYSFVNRRGILTPVEG